MVAGRRFGNYLTLAVVTLVAAAGCRTAPIAWLATDGAPAARVPANPAKCAIDQSHFQPTRQVLLGSPLSEVYHWARTQLPENFRVGRVDTLGLMPSKTPGAALQAQVRESKVALLSVQSQARAASNVIPITDSALVRFLLDATGCSSFRLCSARANIDELTFTGYTTCPTVRVPLRLVASPHRREINSVTVWLPHLVGDEPPE